jgi:hypothetical protein
LNVELHISGAELDFLDFTALEHRLNDALAKFLHVSIRSPDYVEQYLLLYSSHAHAPPVPLPFLSRIIVCTYVHTICTYLSLAAGELLNFIRPTTHFRAVSQRRLSDTEVRKSRTSVTPIVDETLRIRQGPPGLIGAEMKRSDSIIKAINIEKNGTILLEGYERGVVSPSTIIYLNRRFPPTNNGR